MKAGSSFVLAHDYHYPGTSQDVMIATPCKPLRFEMRSTSGSGTFRYICSQISTEGSIDEAGIIRSVNTGHLSTTVATIGTKYPIKAIRKNAAYRCVPVSIQDFSLFTSTANDRSLYTLEINPTLSAPLTYSDVANSALQEASGNGTITVSSAGTIIASGYSAQDSILPTGLLKTNFLAFMGMDINDTPDQYVLCMTPITGGIDAFGTISYKEF